MNRFLSGLLVLLAATACGPFPVAAADNPYQPDRVKLFVRETPLTVLGKKVKVISV